MDSFCNKWRTCLIRLCSNRTKDAALTEHEVEQCRIPPTPRSTIIDQVYIINERNDVQSPTIARENNTFDTIRNRNLSSRQIDVSKSTQNEAKYPDMFGSIYEEIRLHEIRSYFKEDYKIQVEPFDCDEIDAERCPVKPSESTEYTEEFVSKDVDLKVSELKKNLDETFAGHRQTEESDTIEFIYQEVRLHEKEEQIDDYSIDEPEVTENGSDLSFQKIKDLQRLMESWSNSTNLHFKDDDKIQVEPLDCYEINTERCPAKASESAEYTEEIVPKLESLNIEPKIEAKYLDKFESVFQEVSLYKEEQITENDLKISVQNEPKINEKIENLSPLIEDWYNSTQVEPLDRDEINTERCPANASESVEYMEEIVPKLESLNIEPKIESTIIPVQNEEEYLDKFESVYQEVSLYKEEQIPENYSKISVQNEPNINEKMENLHPLIEDWYNSTQVEPLDRDEIKTERCPENASESAEYVNKNVSELKKNQRDETSEGDKIESILPVQNEAKYSDIFKFVYQEVRLLEKEKQINDFSIDEPEIPKNYLKRSVQNEPSINEKVENLLPLIEDRCDLPSLYFENDDVIQIKLDRDEISTERCSAKGSNLMENPEETISWLESLQTLRLDSTNVTVNVSELKKNHQDETFMVDEASERKVEQSTILDQNEAKYPDIFEPVYQEVRLLKENHVHSKEAVLLQLHNSKCDVPLIKSGVIKTVKVQDREEFLKIKEQFMKTTQRHYKIISIDKVDNPYIKLAYQLRRREFELIFGRDKVGIELAYHGTRYDSVKSIIDNNFDWRMHGKAKGNIFGKGVSFSPVSCYSSNYCGKEKLKCMFAASLLVAHWCTATEPLDIPPVLAEDDCAHYDMTKNPKRTVYVKFRDDEFYPDYLIHFKGSPMKNFHKNYYK